MATETKKTAVTNKWNSRKLWLTILAITLINSIPVITGAKLWTASIGATVLLVIAYLGEQGWIDKNALPK